MSVLGRLTAAPAPVEVALGTSGQELGQRMGEAVVAFMRAQWDEISTAVPEWKASLEHLAAYCQGQFSALGGRVAAIATRQEQLAQELGDLRTVINADREAAGR